MCEVRAKGVFPTLQVIDVCSGGSVGRLSKVHLWKLFSLDSLNEHLLSNPSHAELTYRTPTRHRLGAEQYSTIQFCSIFTIIILLFIYYRELNNTSIIPFNRYLVFTFSRCGVGYVYDLMFSSCF